jgi:hypothetical protein
MKYREYIKYEISEECAYCSEECLSYVEKMATSDNKDWQGKNLYIELFNKLMLKPQFEGHWEDLPSKFQDLYGETYNFNEVVGEFDALVNAYDLVNKRILELFEEMISDGSLDVRFKYIIDYVKNLSVNEQK